MIIQFIFILVLSTLLDYLWLGIIAKNYISKLLGDLLIEKTRVDALLFIYLIIASVISFIVRHPNSTKESFIYGAGMGFVVYAIYEFTNLAVIKNWPAKLVLIDIVWGMFMFGIVSALAFYFFKN
jgi:uncharacterized membrane protein